MIDPMATGMALAGFAGYGIAHGVIFARQQTLTWEEYAAKNGLFVFLAIIGGAAAGCLALLGLLFGIVAVMS